MSQEEMDDRTVSLNSFLYDQLKSLGSEREGLGRCTRKESSMSQSESSLDR
jgi:hypothetical protein